MRKRCQNDLFKSLGNHALGKRGQATFLKSSLSPFLLFLLFLLWEEIFETQAFQGFVGAIDRGGDIFRLRVGGGFGNNHLE